MKTWMYEALLVTLFLLASLLYVGLSYTEMLCSLAVLTTFMQGQVADRMHEKQSLKIKPDVHCYKFSRYYYVAKEFLWISYFISIKSYAATVGAFIFILYPFWRIMYRKYKPIQNDEHNNCNNDNIHI